MHTSSPLPLLLSLFLIRASSVPTTGLAFDQVTDLLTPITSPCTGNNTTNRQCWNDGHSICEDFDLSNPITRKTVTYNLDITNTTRNPDGHGEIECLLVNGQYPGPTLTYVVMLRANERGTDQNHSELGRLHDRQRSELHAG